MAVKRLRIFTYKPVYQEHTASTSNENKRRQPSRHAHVTLLPCSPGKGHGRQRVTAASL